MPLIRLTDVQLSFGTPPIFDNINLGVKRGERVCILGRNGEGKSTLLKVLSGEQKIDDGELWFMPGARIVRLQQEVPQGLDGSVFDVVADGLGKLGELVAEYHHLSEAVVGNPDEKNLNALADVQQRLEVENGWEVEQRASQTIKRLELNADANFAALSGGMKRRVMLARALVQEPDVLLLDEPTNHLDIAAIKWLEGFLKSYKATLIFITHDRAFLQALATRIVEVDRGQLYSWDCNYTQYLERKEQALHAEEMENARFDKKLAQEEVWIRQGIKARRTRNEGRVRALKALREERKKRRNVIGKARMQLQQSSQGAKIVFEVDKLQYKWGNNKIVDDFSSIIVKGDRVGVIGPNGCGKSTLIKLLLGDIEPDSGSIKRSNTLEIAYFDQLRSQLNPEATVMDNVADGHEFVTINGQSRHVLSYLQDFLFAPARARQPVSALSGGERNRLLLARLFTRPTNLLVMDEPTNDLDIETLELLEELLMTYEGTLILVSHDRSFMNNVVTSCIVMDGNGEVNEYLGGYDDIPDKKQQPELVKSELAKVKPKQAVKSNLSYKDKLELEALPLEIEKLEDELEKMQQKMAEPEYYQQDQWALKKANKEHEKLEQKLASCYERWEKLDNS